MKNKYLLVLSAIIIFFSTVTFSQTWEELEGAPVGRHHPIAFSIDGKGYAITGTLSNQSPTKDAYEYDPSTDTWDTISEFPGTARSFGIGTVVNGVAYLGFGASNFQYLNDLWSFEPSTETWTKLANCGCSGRRHPAMIAIGNRIYVGLGDDFTGDLDDWWMYDILEDEWTQIADFPGPPRHHPFMFNAGGEVFAGLGHRGLDIFKDWYKLDTATNTWSAMNDFPGEARVAGTQFSYNGLGYVLSGDGDDHSYMETGEMWEYDPTTDSWIELTPHPGISRWAPGSFLIENNIYFFGGQNRQNDSFPDDLFKFSLPKAEEEPTVGISTTKINNISIYPNPASGSIQWESDENINHVKVFNAIGQLVLESNTKENKLNTQSLENGMYVVQLFSNQTSLKSVKLLIQH